MGEAVSLADSGPQAGCWLRAIQAVGGQSFLKGVWAVRHSTHHTPSLSHTCAYTYLAQTHITLPSLKALVNIHQISC